MAPSHAKNGARPGPKQIEIPTEALLCDEYRFRKCVNLYNELEVLRNVSDYSSDSMRAWGFQEDSLIPNIRVLLTGSCCAVAVAGSFFLRLETHAQLLGFFVALFYFLVFLMMAFEALCLKYAYAVFLDRRVRGQRIYLDVALKRKEASLTFGVRSSGGVRVTRDAPLGTIFDAEGFLQCERLYAELRRVFVDFLRSPPQGGGGDFSKKKRK